MYKSFDKDKKWFEQHLSRKTQIVITLLIKYKVKDKAGNTITNAKNYTLNTSRTKRCFFK